MGRYGYMMPIQNPRGKILGIVSAVILLYIGGYIWFRETHMSIAPSTGMDEVIFPTNRVAYYFFRPASYIDSIANRVNTHIGPHVVAQNTTYDKNEIAPYRDLIIKTSYVYLSENAELIIDSKIQNPSKTKTYFFVTSPEMAGNKFYGGVILEVDTKTKAGQVITDFANLSSSVNELTFSPDERFFFYASGGNSSADCRREFISVVNTQNDDTRLGLLRPPVDISPYDNEATFVWVNHVTWKDNHTIEFDAHVVACDTDWAHGKPKATSHWQYDTLAHLYTSDNIDPIILEASPDGKYVAYKVLDEYIDCCGGR